MEWSTKTLHNAAHGTEAEPPRFNVRYPWRRVIVRGAWCGWVMRMCMCDVMGPSKHVMKPDEVPNKTRCNKMIARTT